MRFSDLPTDIRLLIYEELLVAKSPINFTTDYGPSSPPLNRHQRDGLCPQMLRVSRRTYHESVPILYSKNVFRFPVVLSDSPAYANVAYFTPFLDQVGAQALNIRHICLDFPEPEFKNGILKFDEIHAQNLARLRNHCNSIKVLQFELSVESRSIFEIDLSITRVALHSLNAHLTGFTTLQRIMVEIHSYDEEDWDSALADQMDELGWNVSRKLVDRPKELWESDNGQFIFDNYEDYHAYLQDQARREQEEEERQWIEEYYARRRDPYWKNDSDYD